MEAGYPYDSISINRREVSIADIINETVRPETGFEKNTFAFVRRWFLNDQTFDLSTSGSTGNPKRIMLRRRQLIASAEMTCKALGLRPEDQALICLDTRYIAGQMMLVRCFVAGMRVIAVEPEANPLRSVPPDLYIDFAAFVPYQIYHILDSSDSTRFSGIRNILIGGAPLRADAAALISTFPASVFLTYGMTETISHIALHQLKPGKTDRIFETLPGVTISLDERGCLVIWAEFLDEKQVTNDLVEIRDATSFKWLGRIDDVINSGGVKISPETVEPAIEKAFRDLNLHRRFLISAIPDEVLGAKVVLVIEGESLDEALKNTLFKQFNAMLRPFERPKKILVLPVFPQTDTGKIQRNVIGKMLSSQPQN